MTSRPVDLPDETQMTLEDELVMLRVCGELGIPEMKQMFAMGEELFARNGYIMFLIDARHSTGMHPDARKLNAEHMKRVFRPSHTAIYNVSKVARIMATLTQRGVAMVTGKTYPVSFHSDEAEARAMLASQRATLRGAG